MIDSILNAYLVCALWLSSDDDTPLNETHDLSDISEETKTAAREDIADFIGLLDREGVQWSTHWTPDQFGHDFWLTRNGHGAGFWDRYGLNDDEGHALGQTLTKWAETFGGVDLYIGDDGKVYA